jgi:hypothetical protein
MCKFKNPLDPEVVRVQTLGNIFHTYLSHLTALKEIYCNGSKFFLGAGLERAG